MARIGSLAHRLEVPREGGTEPDRWINNDIKPIEAARRTWTFWHFHNFWVVSNMNISTYMAGSALIPLGLNWWQAVIAIIVGNLLATGFVVLNSLPGAYYHVGFPVANRYVWGMYGSYFVLWNRILLSIVWYGFQAWIGGECLYVCLQAIWPTIEDRIPNTLPESTGTTTSKFVAYIVFMIISLPLVWIRPHRLKKLFYLSAATILVFLFVLLVWALATMGADGFGDTITGEIPPPEEGMEEEVLEPLDSVGWLVVYGIISTIGAISAGILNQNDYARFSQKPRNAIYGQVLSFPFYGILCSIIGILVTAATQVRYGEPLWDPASLLSAVIETGGSRSRAAAFFGAAALVVSQLGLNVTNNALSGGMDFAATFPKYLNIRRGAYITVALSIVCNPWQLVNTATTFLAVMSAYSVFLGPMIGCMIASYHVVNKQKINVDDLYVGNVTSIYWYSMGVNWRALVAWLCGTVPSLPGFIANVDLNVIVPIGCTRLFQICFLSGFAISFTVYVALHFAFPVRSVNDFVNTSPNRKEVMRQYREATDAAAAPDGTPEGGSEDGAEKTTLRSRFHWKGM